MATTYKIHPAIGVARLGNSPDEFFIGPELPGAYPDPPGGFKDSQCRVRRQAARFRIFAHHDDQTAEEITKAEADITWTVHLANKKAAFGGRGNSGSASQLTIDPGSRTLNGPNQRQLFDTGTISFQGSPTTAVPLGEIRSDTENHLIVLGGSGHSASPSSNGLGDFWQNTEWFDDTSDGPVTATIKLLSDNSTPAVAGAWVIVTPPKFSPQQNSIITLYDRVRQVMIQAGLVAEAQTTSYTQDVYPILQRARDIHWVISIPPGAMTWPDPVISDSLRTAIFSSLKKPGGGGDDMPQINPPDHPYDDPLDFQTDRLTVEQYAHMQRWNDNNYANDWVGPPQPQASITTGGLDRAALEACVGGSMYPGIEAGGLPQSASGEYPGLATPSRPIATASNYSEAFRLDHSVLSPGDITAAMALPWQADFRDCAENWWPVPRPNEVTRGGQSNQSWTAGIVGTHEDMVAKWSQLGFVVRQGGQSIEVARCDTASITLLTPVLNFQDVPQGPMGMKRPAALAIVFEVISPSAAVILQYTPTGLPTNPQLTAFNTSVTLGPTAANTIATARFWIVYETGNVGDVLSPQTVTIEDSGGTQSWDIVITGNTVARKTAAAALVLDRSGSMSEDRGDGQSKHASLQQAASIFVDLMLEGDGVGLVCFNQDAQVLQQVVTLGDGSLNDINRGNTKDTINGNGLDPNGETSIGDGIFEGRGILNAAATFDTSSLIVLTDGMENSPRMIADVAPQIDEFTYAVGLGQPQNISVPALQSISGNNGGYLLITGAIGTDNRFLLQKYFLQILAGISNAEIVLDPSGSLIAGQVERVPFQLTSEDAGVDVILLTPATRLIDFRLQAPSGRIIEPWRALSEPGMRFILSEGVSYYRLALPTQLIPNRFDGGGTWNALLTIGKPHLARSDSPDGVDRAILRATPRMTRPTRGAAFRRRAIVSAEQFAAFGPQVAGSSMDATARTLPYSIVVHAYSNVSLRAFAAQDGFEPGARIKVSASLTQSGIPLTDRGRIWVEITRPDTSAATVALVHLADGQFSASFETTMSGVYRLRFRAYGTTSRGQPFTRERTLTAAVWIGGNRPPPPAGSLPGACSLLKCLLGSGGIVSAELERKLQTMGLNVAAARKCLEGLCDHGI